ncbi:arrestin domain-containing protein 2-like isoform X1 [Phycodurus eques]|uniref:arrestin domain-containing protein 2-like isoform X1 n=1 Tax=Phycodurus eques TaxID=693459 RepID=UPI002ACD987F|nr:arrestin domain-containing protein 2-like isoform X1 [Phycodurus eques]
MFWPPSNIGDSYTTVYLMECPPTSLWSDVTPEEPSDDVTALIGRPSLLCSCARVHTLGEVFGARSLAAGLAHIDPDPDPDRASGERAGADPDEPGPTPPGGLRAGHRELGAARPRTLFLGGAELGRHGSGQSSGAGRVLRHAERERAAGVLRRGAGVRPGAGGGGRGLARPQPGRDRPGGRQGPLDRVAQRRSQHGLRAELHRGAGVPAPPGHAHRRRARRFVIIGGGGRRRERAARRPARVRLQLPPAAHGAGDVVRGQTRQRALLGEGGASASLDAARQGQEGVRRLRAHRHQHAAAAGDSIQIFAEVENCSARAVVPKAALYQTQTFFAKGKGKEIRRPVSDLSGEALARGRSQSWDGRVLKIPPVSPSILDCPIIRVEYALVVYVDVPGGLNLSLSLPLVIGTIPLHTAASRTASISSRGSASSWLALAERPEAPPSYSELAIPESHRRRFLHGVPEREREREHASAALLTYITEFRYLPPPLYAEVDPYPEPADPGRPDTCPPRR